MPETMSMSGVEGMQAFLRKIKAMDADSPKMVRKSLNVVAEDVVVEAKRRAPVRKGKLRQSIRASSTGYKVRVSEGGNKVPYAGFIDYGGTVGRYRKGNIHHSARRANTARFFAVRPYIKTGRILYPAFRDQRQQVLDGVQAVLVKTAKEHGVGVE